LRATKFRRFFHELTVGEQGKIRDAAFGSGFVRVKVVGSGEVGGSPCFLTTVNNVPFCFRFSGGEESGALHFPDDPRAQGLIRVMLRGQIWL